MSTEFTSSLTLTGVCAFNYSGVAVSSASWGTWNDTSNAKLGFAGQRATTTIRHAFVYAFTTPSWSGDITKITMAIKLQEELGSNRTIRWSLTTTDPTSSTTLYTGQDLPTDSGRIDDGTIEVTASTDQAYTIEISLNALSQNTTYYLVLSPYTTASGASNYATVNMQSSWADVFTGYITYEADASDVSVPDGTIGTAITITMTDDGLAKTLTYEFGSASGTIVSGTTAASVTWTPPLALCNQIPNATSGTLTVTCTTSAGTTTDTATLTVPSSVKPYITAASTTISPYNANAVVAAWNIYLQNFSQIELTIAARATYSATIASWKFVSDVITIEGTASTTSISVDTLSDILTAAGTFTGTLSVTDSRGRTTTLSLGSFTVVAYSAPSATNYSIYRCQADGTRDDSDGTYLYCLATQSYTQVGSNTCSMTFQYKQVSAASFTSVSLTSGTALVTGSGNINVLKSYICQIVITDSLTSTTISVTISTQETPFNMYPSEASGIGIGGYAQEERILELFGNWKLRVPSASHIIVYDGNTQKTLQDLLDDISGS